MDCRKPLVAVFGLLSGLAGCGPSGVLPLTQQNQTTPPVVASRPRQENGEAKVTPKPATCVAAGHSFEAEAEDPRCEPSNRERLRDQARRAYQQALEIDPGNLTASRKLAHLYMTMGDHERAAATLQRGLQKSPNEPSLHSDLGMCQARQKDWNHAVASLNRAVELDPENRQYLNTLGHCLARAGRVDESLVCFRRTVSEAQAQYNVARMLHHTKQTEQARQHLQLALQADPELEPAKEMLAQLDGKAPQGVIRAGLETLDEGGAVK